jgi:hemerythrin-like domain-containing protein
MQAIEVLSEEHRHILRVLDATELAVARARAEQRADAQWFARLSRFIEVFADGAHHAKEEDVLFKALEDCGLPTEGGPLHCMLVEHTMGRGLRQQLEGAAAALERGDGGALFDVLDTSSRYAELLRSHIRKEDMVLYPMAVQLLPPEAFAGMLERYAQVSRVSAGEFRLAANALAEPYAQSLGAPA